MRERSLEFRYAYNHRGHLVGITRVGPDWPASFTITEELLLDADPRFMRVESDLVTFLTTQGVARYYLVAFDASSHLTMDGRHIEGSGRVFRARRVDAFGLAQ